MHLTSPVVLCGAGVSIISNPVLERKLKTLHDSASLSEKVCFLLLLLYWLLAHRVSCVRARVLLCLCAVCIIARATAEANGGKASARGVFAPLACEQMGRIQLGDALPARSQ